MNKGIHQYIAYCFTYYCLLIIDIRIKHYINSVTFAYIDNLVKHFTSNTNDPITTHNVSMSSITDSDSESVETRDQVDERANLTNDLFPSEPEKNGRKEDNDARSERI